MYDADGNGWIDLMEMTQIVKSIYSMMGPEQVRPSVSTWSQQARLVVEQNQSAEERAEGIFKRMDINSDGKVTR